MPGVNEELGATVVWGTQKLGLAGKGSEYDGVTGFWYGKAPGVDRAGDVLTQASASGTAAHGGVLALCGDDLLAKSSLLPAQSEYALQHFEVPFFSPADLQDVLDYGLHAIALSRYAGNWSGMICVADTMDASGLVSVDADRLAFVRPAADDPRRNHDINRALLLGNRLETERLLRDVRLPGGQPPTSAPTASTEWRSARSAAGSASSPPARPTAISCRRSTSSASTRRAPAAWASRSTRSQSPGRSMPWR